MSKAPDAWEEEWSTVAETAPTPPPEAATEPKKVSTKATKAQRRAQHAEFNRQLWDEAEKPQETNYFLESRNIVPNRSEFKPPPILLSRKGPVMVSKKPPTDGINSLNLRDESSEDEDAATNVLTLAERQAQAAKEREEKQRKYEERRQELFGNVSAIRPKSSSGNTSPGSLTPPNSRSSTPNRRGGRGGRRGGPGSSQPQQRSQRELFDPTYAPKPDSAYLLRRENGMARADAELQPIRAPKGPDGSGRGGAGFATRGARPLSTGRDATTVVETT